MTERLARKIVLSVLARIEVGRLTVVEGGERAELSAAARLRRPSASGIPRHGGRCCAAAAGWLRPIATVSGTRPT